MAEPAVEATRDAPLLRLLLAGPAHSQALAAALAVPVRTVQLWLGRLRERGLVEQRTRGSWTLTGAGKRAALAATVPEPTASIASLDTLPAEHRAMLRLIEDAVVARRALRDVYPSNWPAFILLGPTKSGKTLLGTLAARRFGLDPIATRRLLMREKPGSLLGRRVQTGPASWEIVPSPLLSLPLVMFDEFDKASPEQRQAVFAYLDGVSRYQSEERELDIQATVIVALNAERDLGLLPDAYLRRSVVLDTAPLAPVVRDLDLVAAALARVVLPVVGPDLTPPAADLAADARRGLRTLLQNCLTERGWQLIDVEAVSRLVLGRSATLPTDLVAAVVATAADYLLVTATRAGLVVDDWPLVFERTVGPAAAAASGVLADARSRLAVQAGQQAVIERADVDETVALSAARQVLLDRIDYAVDTAPRKDLTPAERDTKGGAFGAARPLRKKVVGARNRPALAELATPVENAVLGPLRALTETVEARRQGARQAQAQQEAGERRQAGERSRAAEARQALYRRLTTRPEESVLDTLVAAGCLTQRSEPYEEETGTSRFQRGIPGDLARAIAARTGLPNLSKPDPVYETKTRRWYEDRAGHGWWPDRLVAWGSSAVDAVLQAAQAAEGLPPLTRPAPPRASPRRA